MASNGNQLKELTELKQDGMWWKETGKAREPKSQAGGTTGIASHQSNLASVPPPGGGRDRKGGTWMMVDTDTDKGLLSISSFLSLH